MKHKKSKYKSLVINKKRYYFYKITWLDIVGDAGHADGSEFSKFQPATMISYGYIFSKDNQCLRSFASHDLMGQPQTNKCSKCAKDYFITDNQFFCDNCKPNKKETLSDLDANSDECLSCQ